MLVCLLLGDSIALRLAPQLPRCEVVATGGITSAAVAAAAPADRGFTRVIVSMGGNDWKDKSIRLEANLATVRARYPKARFTWLAPRRGRNATVIADFARAHGDAVVPLADFPARDTTHPDDFAAVAARVGE